MGSIIAYVLSAVGIEVVRQVFRIKGDIAKEELEKVNNSDIQRKAMDSVRVASRMGLKDGEARSNARAALVKKLQSDGREMSDCEIDTILQNAYFAFKKAKKKG